MGRKRLFIAGLALQALAEAGCGGKWTDGRNASGSAGAFASGGIFVGVAGAPAVADPASAAGAPAVADPPANDLGVWLIPQDGWVDRQSNALQIQGAIYSHADDWSAPQMTSDFTGANACIRGSTVATSAYCEQMHCCDPRACSGTIWGVAISLNLNQREDPSTMGPGVPGTFDGSALEGFAFELSGRNLPAPQALDFELETYRSEYHNQPTKKLVLGVNTILFDELSLSSQESSTLVRISWRVLTDYTTEIPYDFCVSNIRALRKR